MTEVVARASLLRASERADPVHLLFFFALSSHMK